MLLITELSTRKVPPRLLAYEQGVWWFTFDGDATYTDDNGLVWYWPIQPGLETIRGVTVGITNYLEVSTIANCIATEESFYWDDINKRLYVHHLDNANDYAIGDATYRILEVSAGFATGRYPGQPSYYSNQYYDPSITSIGRLSKRVDPLKFGLLSFESSEYELANAGGSRDGFTNDEALNSQVRFFIMPEGERDTANGVRIFTGYTGGAKRSDESLSVQLQEARTFYNRLICPNVFTATDYPNIQSRWEGKPIPVAYGDIRRGIAIPIDTDGFSKSSGGTVTFKLADDSIHPIRAVTALYDENGNAVTPGTIDLTACTVQYSVPANADLDLNKFSWQGEGYAITTGTYNNGLDIIRDTFAEQGNLQFSVDTFDATQWNAETAANPQPIGISIQSDKGLIEELIEPITVSLQGIVDVLGDGRVTFRSRDPEASISKAIYQYQIIDGPSFEIKTDEVVSSVVVSYAPNFVDSEDTLQAIYDDNEDEVTAAYAVKSTQPVSPVQTVLTVEADALAVGEEVASTSSDPQEIVQITIPLDTEQIQLFDVIQVDVSRPQQAPDWRVYEVLERTLGLLNGDLVIDLVLRLLPDRQSSFPFALQTELGENILTEAGDLILTEQGEVL